MPDLTRIGHALMGRGLPCAACSGYTPRARLTGEDVMTQPTFAESAPQTAPNAAAIARSAAVVIFILAAGKAFSLSEKWIGLDRFGIGLDWDTFATANQLPEQLYNLIGGGALAFAFIPVFGGLLGKDRAAAWRLASNLLNTVLLVAFTLATITAILAPWLVANVLAPGYANPYAPTSAITNPLSGELLTAFARPDRVMQTANLMRILLLSLVIFSASGLFSGILHTHQHFILPALSPILFDVGNLFGVTFLASRFGIYGAAIGAVMGASLHALIQVPGLIRCRAQWRPLLDWRDPALREVIVLMIPRAIGLALANFDLLVAYNIASQLETGSSAALNRGYTLMQLPQTLIGTAMGIVIFPTLAVLSAAGDRDGKRAAMSGALRFILIASIPAAIMMVVAGRPLVGILEGGAFDPDSADRVFNVLRLFALSVVTWSVLEVVARSFYADKDMVTPLIGEIIQTVLFLILATTFVQTLRIGGVAFANGLTVGLQVIFLLVILRRRWGGIHEGTLILTTLKALAASGVMALAMTAVWPLIESLPLPIPRRFLLLVQAGLQIGVGGVVYLIVATLLGVTEIRRLPGMILSRRKQLSPAAD